MCINIIYTYRYVHGRCTGCYDKEAIGIRLVASLRYNNIILSGIILCVYRRVVSLVPSISSSCHAHCVVFNNMILKTKKMKCRINTCDQ